jgi:hypothetical protein
VIRLLPLVLLCACTEERIIKNRPFLSGVPGAVTSRPVTPIEGALPPDEQPPDSLVQKTPDGKKVLVAKTGRQLMVHIYNTLEDKDAQLFLDQVLSEMTKTEFYQRGVDPREAYVELLRRREDIDLLFSRMPMGEATPGVIMTKVGRGMLRLRVDGMAARDLPWSGMDIVMEKGNFRLRWFVDGPAAVRAR